MGVNDLDILDFLRGKEEGKGCLEELWDELKSKPDITRDWVINDIKNLEKDGLLNFDEESGELILLPKANKPVEPLPPDVRRK